MRFAAVAVLAAFAASAALAEDAPKKAPEAPAAPAPAAPAGPDTTTDTFGDWSLLCSRPNGTDRVCEVNTAITVRNQQAPFARVIFTRPTKDKPPRLVGLVPVNVTTGAPVKIAFGPGKLEFPLAIHTCVPGGCIADAEVAKDQLALLRAPLKGPGQLSLTDAAGRTVSAPLSVKGLDQALDAYLKAADKGDK